MSLDNPTAENGFTSGEFAAAEIEAAEFAAAELEVTEEVTTDVYGAMSDRDLLEYIARNIDAALTIAHTIQEQVGPVVEKFSKNPLFGGLFRG